MWIAFRIPPYAILPFEHRHFFGPLASRLRDGVLEFYDVSVPFPVGEHPRMNEAVLVAVFVFALAVALAIAARRPLIASVALLTGSVWPATLVGGDDLARGALTLAAVLSLFAFGGRRPTRAVQPAIVLAALLVATAVGASTSVAVAKPEFLSWKSWDFYDKPADPVGVAYVWNANYGALKWPDKETTVLKVRGPRRNLYWRATALDFFAEDRWVEGQQTVRNISDRPVDLTRLGDPLLPRRAYDRSRWIRSEVEVAALRDRHLVGPSMPVAYDPNGAGTLLLTDTGMAALSDYVPRGAKYVVWSYAPQPKPEQLARAGRPRQQLVRGTWRSTRISSRCRPSARRTATRSSAPDSEAPAPFATSRCTSAPAPSWAIRGASTRRSSRSRPGSGRRAASPTTRRRRRATGRRRWSASSATSTATASTSPARWR